MLKWLILLLIGAVIFYLSYWGGALISLALIYTNTVDGDIYLQVVFGLVGFLFYLVIILLLDRYYLIKKIKKN